MDVFDEAGFLQNGVHFAFGLEEVHGGGTFGHFDDPRAAAFGQIGAGLEVAADATAQVLGFADVEHLVVGVFHKVQTGSDGERLDRLPDCFYAIM